MADDYKPWKPTPKPTKKPEPMPEPKGKGRPVPEFVRDGFGRLVKPGEKWSK